MLSEEEVNDFQQLYLAQFGIALSKEEAESKASVIIALVRILSRLDG